MLYGSSNDVDTVPIKPRCVVTDANVDSSTIGSSASGGATKGSSGFWNSDGLSARNNASSGPRSAVRATSIQKAGSVNQFGSADGCCQADGCMPSESTLTPRCSSRADIRSSRCPGVRSLHDELAL